MTFALEPAKAQTQNPVRSISSQRNSQDNHADQPAWSPTPFQANPLRESPSNSRAFHSTSPVIAKASAQQVKSASHANASGPQTASTTTQTATKSAEVLRWRKVEAPLVSAKQLTAPVISASTFEDPATKQPTPRSSLLIQQPSQAAPKTLTLPSQDSPLRPAPQSPTAPASETLSKEIPAQEIPAPALEQPPALSLPPATQPPALSLPPATQPPALNLPPANAEPVIKAPEPMPESILPKDPSTTEKIQTLPNPFPNPSGRKLRDPAKLDEPNEIPAPSALAEPNKLDDDLPPAPPKRADQSVANCELVRNFAAGADIRNFQLDTSPDFFQGFQSSERPDSLTKETFIKKSPARTWRGSQGEYVAEGKLVDLVYGTVVIEQEDGKRVSYLQRKLSDADQVYVSEAWGVPVSCPLGDQGFAPRFFVDSTFTWKASGACNKPLYFEDVSLERYGHEWGPVVQPVVSTVRFFGDLAVLPYKMGIHPPNECQHPLGYYRPGSCAPWSIRPVPLSMRGAVTQAAFVTGTAFTLP